MHDEVDREDGERASAEQTNISPRQWTSDELLDGSIEAIIVHAGEVYRLRCTRNNKLILHK